MFPQFLSRLFGPSVSLVPNVISIETSAGHAWRCDTQRVQLVLPALLDRLGALSEDRNEVDDESCVTKERGGRCLEERCFHWPWVCVYECDRRIIFCEGLTCISLVSGSTKGMRGLFTPGANEKHQVEAQQGRDSISDRGKREKGRLRLYVTVSGLYLFVVPRDGMFNHLTQPQCRYSGIHRSVRRTDIRP